MTTGLVILGISVVGVMLVGNVCETVAHKPSPTARPLTDLRLSYYAPNIAQVRRDQREYQENQRKRKYEDYRIKQWLEGNPTPLDEEPTVYMMPIPDDIWGYMLPSSINENL